MRKLATIEKILDINPIQGADAIEVATVRGWKVVVKKGEYSVGDWVVYFEIDSFIPHEYAPFLSKGKEPSEYNGVRGERLRTVKLRGQISQGLVLPVRFEYTNFVDGGEPHRALVVGDKQCSSVGVELVEGFDVTDTLGIQKWERPLSAQLAGLVEGVFPHFIPKTDQERAQNLLTEIFEDNKWSRYEVTIKLEGSSCTVFRRNDVRGVCSRNLWLKNNEDNAQNTFIKTVNESGLWEAIEAFGRNIAIQCELMGPGVEGNHENFKEHKLFVYDIWNIDEQRYHTPTERRIIVDQLLGLGIIDSNKFAGVPVLHESMTTYSGKFDPIQESLEELLKIADGPSIVHPCREGLVWKRHDGGFSFKTISNEYLEKFG